MIQSRSINIVFSLGLLTLLIMSSFGVLHLGMNMGPNGTMSDCPFSLGGSLCTMTPLQHIAAAQSLFSTLLVQKNILSLFLLLISSVIIFIFFSKSTSSPKLLSYNYAVDREYVAPRGFLQEAFSRGVLHSKAF